MPSFSNPPAIHGDDEAVVGVLRIRLIIRGARSLKDKRSVVKSVKDRVRHRFNVSIAEVGEMESHQTALLGVAVVGNATDFVQSVLAQVENVVRGTRDAEVAGCDVEII